MERIPDVMLLGQRPHRHHLLHFETARLWEMLQKNGKSGFALADQFIRNGVVGLHRGMSKHVKLSIYGLSPAETEKVINLFYEVAEVGKVDS